MTRLLLMTCEMIIISLIVSDCWMRMRSTQMIIIWYHFVNAEKENCSDFMIVFFNRMLASIFHRNNNACNYNQSWKTFDAKSLHSLVIVNFISFKTSMEPIAIINLRLYSYHKYLYTILSSDIIIISSSLVNNFPIIQWFIFKYTQKWCIHKHMLCTFILFMSTT